MIKMKLEVIVDPADYKTIKKMASETTNHNGVSPLMMFKDFLEACAQTYSEDLIGDHKE